MVKQLDDPGWAHGTICKFLTEAKRKWCSGKSAGVYSVGRLEGRMETMVMSEKLACDPRLLAQTFLAALASLFKETKR